MSTAEEFRTSLTSGELVLVDVWAEWCGPCRMMAPIIEKIKREYVGKMNVLKIDADNNPEIAEKYNIQSLPTLVFFKDGKEVLRIVGATSESNLKRAADTLLV
jgi:thioredoxin